MILEELIRPLDELESREIKANNNEIVVWIQKVRSSCLDVSNSRDIIPDLIEIRDNHDVDPYDEKSPYYSLLLAYARVFFDDIDGAVIDIELSISGFKNLGKEKVWQQAVSNWFYGLLLCKQGQCDSAKAKVDIAIDIFSKLDKEQCHFGEYCAEYRNMIETIQTSYNEAFEKQIKEQKTYVPKKNVDSPLPQRKSRYNTEVKKKQFPTHGSTRSNQTQKPRKKPQPRPPKKRRTRISQGDYQVSDYIAVPWLPIYQSVCAGPNGIVIMDAPSNTDVTLTAIQIFGVPHNLYSIKKMDRQVTLSHVFTYGLVKVEGNSMNNTQPIHINDGDYVLFSKQQISEENDIVIASRKNPGGDFAYMIKRYMKRDKLLVSESSEQNSLDDYQPIEINKDHQILGVVIAVAKAKK